MKDFINHKQLNAYSIFDYFFKKHIRLNLDLTINRSSFKFSDGTTKFDYLSIVYKTVHSAQDWKVFLFKFPWVILLDKSPNVFW